MFTKNVFLKLFQNSSSFTVCTTADTPCIAKDPSSVFVGGAVCGCKTGFSLAINGKCYQSSCLLLVNCLTNTCSKTHSDSYE